MLLACAAPPAPPTGAVHMANGIKIGEVRQTSAMVWARLTRDVEPRVDGVAFSRRKPDQPQLPDGVALDSMRGAVAGAAGELRVVWWREGRQRQRQRRMTPWHAVDADTDFAHRFTLDELRPGSAYRVVVEGREAAAAAVACRVDGRFGTAPAAAAPAAVSFCVISCQDYPRRDAGARGHRIYGEMLELAPDFLVHTGDTLYYDKPRPYATTVALARFKWNRLYGLTLQREFHRQVSCYFQKDDHDLLKNDCWSGQRYGELSWQQGLAIYREQLPVAVLPYRQVRWGRDLEIWLVEGREFRSPNRMPDGPDKTIWGEDQMRWLRQTMSASDASWRVLISPTPIVGPDRKNKNDNHSNAGFAHEGAAVRRFLAGLGNVVVICGDRHWQYASRDAATGLREFGCGPSSDAHAGGFRLADRSPMHEYLAVRGGFLQVAVLPVGDRARLVLRHRGVDGSICNEVVLGHE